MNDPFIPSQRVQELSAKPLKSVVITGATGFIGGHLAAFYEKANISVTRIGRKELSLEPKDLAALMEGADSVINLAGAPILKRWTNAYRKEIMDSRVNSTRKLVGAMECMNKRPKVFISASAVGIYDNEHTHDENSTYLDQGFLGEGCRRWEQEAVKAQPFARVAIIRLGVVLANNGGAMAKMLLPFRLGLGGPIGSGRQAFPWIHLLDVLRAIAYIAENDKAYGPVNLVAPVLNTNYDFSKELALSLNRPMLLKIPPFMLHIFFGMAAVTLTEGQRVLSKKLTDNGYEFTYPTIALALTSKTNIASNHERMII